MKQLILLGYEFITVMLPSVAVILVFRLCRGKEQNRFHKEHLIGCLIFSCYLFALLHITGAGTLYDGFRYGLNSKLINLIPFSDTNIDILGYFLNVVLFFPLGLMLPLLWAEFGNCKPVIFAGAALSLLVELSQLINNRATDVDDLILNTFGTFLGYLVYKLIRRTLKSKIPAEAGMKTELILLISMPFLCRFFLFNEFGMAKYLYGF